MNIYQREILFADENHEVTTIFRFNTKEEEVFTNVREILELTPFETREDRDNVAMAILQKGDLLVHPKDARAINLEVRSTQVFLKGGLPLGTRTNVTVINP